MKAEKSSIEFISGTGTMAFIIIFLFFSVVSYAQKITEENYTKLDNEIWEQYEEALEKISECVSRYPEKQDSLMKVSNDTWNIASKKNRELAMKFAAVPSGLQRLFMLRLDISKDTLKSVLSGLPKGLKNSPYRKSILAHIQSEQIKEGDKYYDFEATTSAGEKFILSSLEGKNILLLYGGLGCMGKVGRTYLDSLYKATAHQNLKIVVYSPDNNLEGLKEVRNTYSCDYLLISDFLEDHSPVKILYGAQATPTCFFINRRGVVEMKTIGLNQERVNELVYQNK